MSEHGTVDVDELPIEARLESWRFDLPEVLIAQVPASDRDGSRLMVLPRVDGSPIHAGFKDLPSWLRSGDVLVVNDTRVLPARLFARKDTGGRVELLVLDRRHDRFSAMFGTHRGLRQGARLEVLDLDGQPTGICVLVQGLRPGGIADLSCVDAAMIDELLARHGRMPLPPYIRREGRDHSDLDRERYQTVYACREGAVAAPTAGLHFTPDLLATLEAGGIRILRVTLHVGPGTFKPISTPDVRDHDVGEERYDVSSDTALAVNQALADGRRVIAVGTTAVRTLEAAGATGRVVAGEGATRLLITPGYRFKVVTGMVTNFHLPGSSLVVLVGALAGRERVLSAYREAIGAGYRFYSYGDAMLVL